MNEQYGLAKSGRTLLQQIFAWMSLGLALTGGVAYYVASTPAIYTALFKNSGPLIILILLQVGIVFGLSFFIQRMSFFAAAGAFIAYSLLSGITFSSIFLIYTHSSIAITFFVAAGMFLALALYGYFTKADLSGMGSFLFMAIIGLIIGGVVNMFLHSESLDYLISAFGVIIFSLLTAYDIQKIKDMSNHMLLSGEDLGKVSIIGALTLYLDFVNLFLYLLRFLGKKRD